MDHSRSPFRLTVLTGANAGAVAPLGTGRVVIGGGASDSIVLDGAMPGHLGVTLDGERVRLAANAEGVAVGDGLSRPEPLPQGKARILPLPVMVQLGADTQLNIARRVPPAGRSLPAAMAALACIVAGAGGLFAGLQMPDSVRLASEMAARAAPAPLPITATPEPAPPLAATVAPRGPAAPLKAMSPQIGPCAEACQTEAQDRLRKQLDEAGLGDLALTIDKGVLRVSGALAEDQQHRWADLRRQFETTYGGSLPLLVALGPAAGGPRLAVSSIWLGSRPELRTRTGEVLGIGDATGDGWIVARIQPGAITLTRDGAETVVRF